MSDVDKTILLEEGSNPYDCGRCPICGQKLQPDWDNVELLRCPACRYAKKVATVIEPGSVVAHKYRILTHLNNGGCGSIFLCYPLAAPSERYVLKILTTPSNLGRKRFRREAEILCSIAANQRVAKLMEYWEVGDDTYIIMEYVDGHNLRELTASCCFDEYNVLLIAYEVTRALQDIWNNFYIIHRDIKPENIMLDNQSHVKLLDFGLSKQCRQYAETSMITVASSTLGTPGYMSPEHFTDIKNVDFRSDIYSLGATLFFLLTGHHVISGGTIMEFYNNTLALSPPPVEVFGESCSVECIKLIRKMMQQDPNKRHSSYEELISEIGCILNSYCQQ